MTVRPEPHILRVGGKYGNRTTPWPEGIEFNYRDNGLELRIHFNGPTPREIRAVQSGAIQYALFADGDQIIMLYRFLFGDEEPGPWSDAPYSWHKLDPDERTLPDLAPGHALLRVMLINARTSIICALRMHTLSEQFTWELFTAITNQATAPYDKAAYNAHLDAIRNRWSTSQLAAMALVTCMGGS